ncbi:MAG TPA: hypothetical protein VGW57_10090 [Chthoniobacterales bacterium]|nr:hypothetical protein [Chthoniobacterales bacterium]
MKTNRPRADTHIQITLRTTTISPTPIASAMIHGVKSGQSPFFVT